MQKLTAWIKCRNQQPTLTGWYDIRAEGHKGPLVGRQWWDGVNWWATETSMTSDYGNNDVWNAAWRGLSENPSAPKEAK